MTNSGTLTAIFFHPETEDCYEVYISWRYYYAPAVYYLSNGDPGYPEESELDYDVELLEINGDPVASGTPAPEWITSDMIESKIDV